MDVLRFIKFKSSSKYKAIFNYTMLYFVILMITGLKFLEKPEK